MGEVLGVSRTHYPGLLRGPKAYAGAVHIFMSRPDIPEEMHDPWRTSA